jgi:hypothetical protein
VSSGGPGAAAVGLVPVGVPVHRVHVPPCLSMQVLLEVLEPAG